jgi:predicted NBD/HSP70 family sugar kinase
MGQGIPEYIRHRLDLGDLTSSRPLLRLMDASGPLSQPEATDRLGLSKGTCNLHFQRLEHEGLLRRVGRVRRGRGRPIIMWDVHREANFYVTLVFDVPFFQASLLDGAGVVIDQRRDSLDPAGGQAAVRRRIHAYMKRAQGLAAARGGRIRQVVAGLPGLLDPLTGAVVRAVNFPSLDGVDLQSAIPGRYGVPCYAGSLGVVFYYGETEGLAPELTAMVIHWDLGVGVVFGRGGRLLTPVTASSPHRAEIPEIGHVRIRRDGRRCHCGRHGCLEAYTGGWAILHALRDTPIHTLDDLVNAVQDGDPAALDAARRAAHLLGKHLVWPIQLMGVHRIIGTGPLAPVFDATREAFRTGLASTLTTTEIDRLNPTASTNPQTRMQHGAYLLAHRLFLYPEEYEHLPRTPSSLAGAGA